MFFLLKLLGLPLVLNGEKTEKILLSGRPFLAEAEVLSLLRAQCQRGEPLANVSADTSRSGASSSPTSGEQNSLDSFERALALLRATPLADCPPFQPLHFLIACHRRWADYTVPTGSKSLKASADDVPVSGSTRGAEPNSPPLAVQQYQAVGSAIKKALADNFVEPQCFCSRGNSADLLRPLLLAAAGNLSVDAGTRLSGPGDAIVPDAAHPSLLRDLFDSLSPGPPDDSSGQPDPVCDAFACLWMAVVGRARRAVLLAGEGASFVAPLRVASSLVQFKRFLRFLTQAVPNWTVDQLAPRDAFPPATSLPPVGGVAADVPRWDGRLCETATALGPLLRLSALVDGSPLVGRAAFDQTRGMTVAQFNSLADPLRRAIGLANDGAHSLLLAVLRKDRAAGLRWIASCLRWNRGRARLHVDPRTVATETFMLNLSVVMVRLFEPFLRPPPAAGDKSSSPSRSQASQQTDSKGNPVNRLTGAGSKRPMSRTTLTSTGAASSVLAKLDAAYWFSPDPCAQSMAAALGPDSSVTRLACSQAELRAWLAVRNAPGSDSVPNSQPQANKQLADLEHRQWCCLPLSQFSDVRDGESSEPTSSHASSSRAGIAPVVSDGTLGGDFSGGSAAIANDQWPNASFLSQCFHLTLYCLHLGFRRSLHVYNQLLRTLEDRREALTQFPVHDRARLPPQARQMLGRMETLIAEGDRSRLCFEVHLLDPNQLVDQSKFYSFVARWLLHLANLTDASTGQPVPTLLSDGFSNNSNTPVATASSSRVSQNIPEPVDDSSSSAPLASTTSFRVVEPTVAFASLPEFAVGDVAEFYDFLLTHGTRGPLDRRLQHDLETMAVFCVLMIPQRALVTSPHTRSLFVDVLSAIAPSLPDLDCLDDDEGTRRFKQLHLPPMSELQWRATLFTSNKSCLDMLPAVLCEFYVEAERTGGSNQFYDKFRIRFRITTLLRFLWSHVPEFPAKFMAFALHAAAPPASSPSSAGEQPGRWGAGTTTEPMTRFVNMLLNDAIFLLDESLEKLNTIHNSEKFLASVAGQPPETQAEVQERNEHRSRIANEGRHLKQMLVLANESVRLLHLLTRHARQLFLQAADMPDRTAAMLNYFLKILAGPRCANLQVERPQRYSFEPKTLLGRIADLYLFLDGAADEGAAYWDQPLGDDDPCSGFAEAVARDGRSFEHAILLQAAQRMRRHAIRPPSDVRRFERFAEKARRAFERLAQQEQDLGEIPEEYLDPIMDTLMSDPVILPSGTRMDMAVIERHLLSDATDPFTRAPLTKDQLVRDDDLRDEIQSWLMSKGMKISK